MENQTKLYPSYMGEFYAANPVKFEKRKNNVKPMLYYGLAVVAVIIVIFPGFIPVAGWLVRTVGVIAVLICLLAAYLSNFDYYNSESGGKIKEVGLKKFKRDETESWKRFSEKTLSIWQSCPEHTAHRFRFMWKRIN